MRIPVWIGLILLIAAPAAPRWGYNAHRLVNRAATLHLPADFMPFAQWVDDLEDLATAADERKCCVSGESIKHYIDVDDYPAFFEGELPHTYDDMIRTYGVTRVEGNGTLPWAIEASYKDLVTHFQNEDWSAAVASAADIGHYVGDLHNPMHLTLNYNGQLTGQHGIHSRHESEMTSRHLDDLTPMPGTIEGVTDPLEAVFGWIDKQYPGVEMILAADLVAKDAAGGSTSSNTYYDTLWEEIGDETTIWIQDASEALASLWYAAWLEAGAPALPGTSTHTADLPDTGMTHFLYNSPNPFDSETVIHFNLRGGGETTLMIMDARGRRVQRWALGHLPSGRHQHAWEGTDASGRPLPSGVYHMTLTVAGTRSVSGHLVRVR